jgi:uncharacterized membrane protein YfcA
MTIANAILLFIAALGAGIMNSIAGGGSFLSFPALIFAGVPPIQANATSTIALWPGTVSSAVAYRNRLPRSARVLAPLIFASLIGGYFGAHLLLQTPQRTFMRLIPFLFLGATLLFAFGKNPATSTRHAGPHDGAPWQSVAGVSLIQFFIAVYGGFFGGGIGILMLAFFTFLPFRDIHAMNGLKTLLASTINAVAIIAFIVAHIIFWPEALIMLVGAALGGYGGAFFAQRINPARVRAFVVCIGFGMSFYFLWRYR